MFPFYLGIQIIDMWNAGISVCVEFFAEIKLKILLTFSLQSLFNRKCKTINL